MSKNGKSVLIVYATREGQTEKIARVIGRHLLDQGAKVTIQNAKDPQMRNLAQFDFVLCGGSMHAGGIERELRNYINHNKQNITRVPNAFFLVLLSAASKDPKVREEWLTDARRKMSDQIPVEFNHTEMIAGALAYSKYSWPLKWIMKRIAKKAGEDTDTSKDYEYTDWIQVKTFAEGLLRQ